MESTVNNQHSRRRRPRQYKIETQRRINLLIDRLVEFSELLMEGNEREHGAINYWLDMV
jgi:hypothetical protein